MKIKSVLSLSVAVLILACIKRTDTGPQGMPPLNPPDLDPRLVEGIKIAEADFNELYARFTELADEYNYHLVDNKTHPEETEKEFFMALCVEDEFEIVPPTDLPIYGRLEFIDIWTRGLYECCEEMDRQFTSHLEFFHPSSELHVELIELIDIPDDTVYVRYEAVEENLRRTAGNIENLGEIYKLHLGQCHP